MWHKIYKWLLGILLLVLIGVVVYIVVDIQSGATSKPEASTEEAQQKEEEPKESEIVELSEEKEESNEAGESFNPFGDAMNEEELTEKELQKYLNYMAHQKIYAEEIWGFYEITPERIAFLLEVLDTQDYPHEDVYRDILDRWEAGDFSQAVSDHNRVWNLQGGTVGEATRLLTEEEEQAILDRNP
ncbi:DUF6241 domain-containing protein [Gracilibacillus timonensis]|uniref:DUF6241 domain-containing protein n=1 Tax=Gracilibacillus timonensis TaxID=1816696 RepID=UPI000825938A|nr:DUF6241 domain-containing protein [Gracilibacillus timonensis]